MSAAAKAALAAQLISQPAAAALRGARVSPKSGKYAVGASSHVLAELNRYGLIARGRVAHVSPFGLLVRDALGSGAKQ